jgi:hypothetical protein
MNSVITFTPHHILLHWNKQLKKYEIGMAYNMHGRDTDCTQGFCR